MIRTVFLLLCALLILCEPEYAAAEPTAAAVDTHAEATEASDIPRPNYKRYKGNSRSKKRRLGFFRRRAARRKAMRKRKQQATAPRGVIKVDAPVGTMPKR
ncbi:MAG TPA: hypothetical protein VK364_05030 [Hymenobacter sp.]|nr:hypothetical protein [Hymenobacter sp.]